MEPPIWHPSEYFLHESRIARFMTAVGCVDWRELIRKSCYDIEWFWDAATHFLGVDWFHPYHTVLDTSRGFAHAQWFVGGTLNIVYNCIDRHVAQGRGERVAFIIEKENGARDMVTYAELEHLVHHAAALLRSHGVRRGERIGMVMTVSRESLAVMFGAMKIGVVPMQMAARLAGAHIAEHLSDAGARLMCIDEAYAYGGRTFTTTEIQQCVRNNAPACEIISMGEDFFSCTHDVCPEIITEPLESEAPALIVFSSGTTGKQKMIVHTHAGALAQITKEVGFAFDCTGGRDTLLWTTDFGWMMAPWEMIGATFFGATCVLVQGSPVYPNATRIVSLVARNRVTIFGTTPPIISALMHGEIDFALHDISSLRILGSTGMTISRTQYEWFFEHVGGRRCPIINISGGTDIMGCFLSPLPVMPLKPQTVGTVGLGMDCASRDGVLVCRKPFPSMTRGFVNAPEKFIETYFPDSPNEWNHGDRVHVDAEGYWFVDGRSDDLIIRNAVKIDPVMIENAVRAWPGGEMIQDVVAVGVPDIEKGNAIVLLVVSRAPLTQSEQKSLRTWVGTSYDPFAKPDSIFHVPELPYTLTGKLRRSTCRELAKTFLPPAT